MCFYLVADFPPIERVYIYTLSFLILLSMEFCNGLVVSRRLLMTTLGKLGTSVLSDLFNLGCTRPNISDFASDLMVASSDRVCVCVCIGVCVCVSGVCVRVLTS